MVAPLLVVLAAVTPAYYEATVSTFGCNSTAEVLSLLSVRNNPEEFGKQLMAKVVYGQCVTIGQGAVVDGSADESNAAMMRIEVAASPPGLMAPASDFKLRQPDGTQEKAPEEKAPEDKGAPSQDEPQP